MENRKLIKFGNSSYVISIPKQWMQKNNLNKGDLVYFTENGSNELILTPSNNQEQRVKLQDVTINIEGKNFNDIKREIVSSYIRNVHLIKIEGKNLDKKVREIRKYLSNLMALEVVEQNKDKIIAKDFLNMKKISMFQTIKKVDAIVDSMLRDSQHMFETDSYESLMVRDEDVNRLVNMVLRVSRYVMRKPHLIGNTGLTPFDFFKYLQVADNLERLGDEAKRLARYLRKVEVDDAGKREIVALYGEICDNYRNVMESFYNNDVERALELATKDGSIRERCDALSMKHSSCTYICVVAEKLKAMDYSIHSIGREVYQ